ncbi:MAG: hypothetical protein CMQ29_15450 [Gammaproteobacteria bacterium]|nr:hypothetical protein [Gammaproteobacteria bacterium]
MTLAAATRRRFIADGFLVIDPGLLAATPSQIDQQLRDLVGRATSAAYAALRTLLGDHDVNMVRVALDALCANPSFGDETARCIIALMRAEHRQWHYSASAAPQVSGSWRAADQVRFMCTWALTHSASGSEFPERVEAALIRALWDETDYLPAIACEGLKRIGPTRSLSAAINFLQSRRWDITGRQLERLSATATRIKNERDQANE